MKGRGNYLCLHRLDLFRDSPMSMAFADADTMAAIGDWAEQTGTGDRAELEDLPEDLSVWSELAATADTCVGSSCPREKDCFITRMRQRAAESDIVIVNHHLLCADASVRQNAYGEVIPECHVAVIDEAHQLEDVATQYFGTAVSTYRLEDLVRDTERVVSSGACAEDPAEVRRASDRVRDRAAVFFEALRGVSSSGGAGGRYPPRTATPDRQRVTPGALAAVQPAGLSLVDALDGLQGVAALVSGAERGRGRDRPTGGRHARRTRVPASSRRSRLRLLRREPRPRRLLSRGADRRVDGRARTDPRPDAGDRADVRHAQRGRVVRVRPPPARCPRCERGQAALRVPVRGAGDSLPAARSARSPLAGVRDGREPGGAGDPAAHRGTGIRPLHQLLGPSGGRAPARLGGRLPGARPGVRTPVGPAQAVPVARQCGAARHLQLLAGRGRGGRSVELRDRGQAAIRVAG